MKNNEIPVIHPVDGTVLSTNVQPEDQLVYVTVAGPDDDRPVIVAFELDDLDAINDARKELKRRIKKRDDRRTAFFL